MKLNALDRFYHFGNFSFPQKPKMCLQFSRGKKFVSETHLEKPDIKKRSIQLIESDDDTLVSSKKTKR